MGANSISTPRSVWISLANRTPNFQLEVTVDGEGPFIINKGEVRTFPLKGGSAPERPQVATNPLVVRRYPPTQQIEREPEKHRIAARAFVLSRFSGRQEIGRKFATTFVSTDQADSPSQEINVWRKVFTYKDFFHLSARIPKINKINRIEPEKGESLPAPEGAPSGTQEEKTEKVAEKSEETGGKDQIFRLIREASSLYRIPSALLIALIDVESAFCENAVSRKGAMGLMQLMPATCERFEVQEPFDPRDNIQGGAKYLSYLLHEWSSRFPHHQRLKFSLAAYNAGEKRVERYGGMPPFKETVNYVTKILDKYNTLNDPQQQAFPYDYSM